MDSKYNDYDYIGDKQRHCDNGCIYNDNNTYCSATGHARFKNDDMDCLRYRPIKNKKNKE